ncbi:MAG: porphobilinogen synthase [Candidatus Calescibacterium sp.]|jgi:porphobilinogen synthase|nr:porphobilinogen synthase [Candidatus Calescibacterium sp.]
MSLFPQRRLRRLRKSEGIRKILSENKVLPEDIMFPIFVWEGQTEEIKNFPDQVRWNIEDKKLYLFLEELVKRGLSSIIVFGVAQENQKDEIGSYGWKSDNVVQKFIKRVKREFPELVIAADVCLCTWRKDGHCGVVKNGEILNDESLELLGKIALSCAEAGADLVAPSDMMDGRVKFIREKLDENGFKNTLIMSYSVKYASALYGPFREAAHSAPAFGDRSSYQMNPSQSREAILEAQLDFEEGADILMVKPALFYLDIIKSLKEKFLLPIAAFNVSGEYTMIKLGIKSEIFDERKIINEALISIKRAGADIIITYFAPEFFGVNVKKFLRK